MTGRHRDYNIIINNNSVFEAAGLTVKRKTGLRHVTMLLRTVKRPDQTTLAPPLVIEAAQARGINRRPSTYT